MQFRELSSFLNWILPKQSQEELNERKHKLESYNISFWTHVIQFISTDR